jgi:nucleotide-binding universal stress UspA family protein
MTFLKGEEMITKILLPTDGSRTAQKAANYAVDLAKKVKASVIVLSVIDKGGMIGQTIPARKTARHILEPIEDYLKEAAEGFAGTIIKICRENRVKSETVVVEGHPVEEILKAAKRYKADLIILGSHGRSALAAALLGSVAYGVIHKESKTPVLIVRR